MGTPYPRILGGHRVGLGHFAEEGFHFPSGQKRDQNSATRITGKCPDMGNLAWCQQRITRLEMYTFRSNLELELAFKDIEPFILFVMQMTCRATFHQEGVLKDEETTWVRRGHLEGNGANAQSALFAKAISTSCDSQCRWHVS